MSERECTNLLIVPVPSTQAMVTRVDVERWERVSPSTCMRYAIGRVPPTAVRATSRSDHVPCPERHEHGWRLTVPRQSMGARVVALPVQEGYYFMGIKMLRMIEWLQTTRVRNVLHMDLDQFARTSTTQIQQMMDEVNRYDSPAIVGDIMRCLSPANQMCCCENAHFAQEWRLQHPFETSPPLPWGGAGIGMNRLAFMRFTLTEQHVHSDHQLADLARSASVPMRQANWSTLAHSWCKGDLGITRLSNHTWRCANRRVYNWTHVMPYTCA